MPALRPLGNVTGVRDRAAHRALPQPHRQAIETGKVEVAGQRAKASRAMRGGEMDDLIFSLLNTQQFIFIQ